MQLFNLLAQDPKTAIPMYIMLGVVVIAVIVMYIFTSRRNKKQQKDAENLMNAIKPGNKVKTIGGICGIVVEVDATDNTFVLETGSETSGKSYLKFDKQAIYQSDAVIEDEKSKKDTNKKEETEEQAADEQSVDETQTPAEENSAVETQETTEE